MTISDELQKLDELRRNGTLSPEEFEIAKRRVLEGPQDDVLTDRFEEIKTYTELAQLDREWQLERENYMISTRYGRRHIPSKSGSVFGGIIIVVFGILWTMMAASMASGSFLSLFPLFGVFFTVAGIGVSIRSFVKAGQYKKAHERYLHRRQSLSKNRQP
ncbi:hypothetical protein C1752_01107 [Acaryochloris thomasi RCC1774]|uniref:SHOCT domain-containing protein n=1 Tax=Acaryochloris thomasi RCC1774 TaxID=1764569 RepID=A0A2W1K2W2_9CYAN|nr:SHOCT domain-containing protein [Acaryochloris thomasi]PZD74357.1 hypothetical protein C1752_01107 [Acaryochloris thomasi RCC1774]